MKYIFLMLLILCSSLSAKRLNPESYYQVIAAKILNAETEVILSDGSRADIISTSHAIEVDWSNKWKEGISQSLWYAFQTNKNAGLILIIKDETDTKEVIKVNSLINHYDLPITLWTIDQQNEELHQIPLLQ